jgi:hypothetical protein
MYNTLKIIGLKYGKTNEGSKFLMKRGGIVAAQIMFLKAVHNIRISRKKTP